MSNKFQKNRGKSGQFQTKTKVGIRPFANANCAQRISAWEGSMVIAISHSPSTLHPPLSPKCDATTMVGTRACARDSPLGLACHAHCKVKQKSRALSYARV